ncbi:hypothetical protein C1H46_001837 [Malus baccata]|uniref:Uncharacterized protein n=1 Tax=Malus baccata TaxID=106549 RepID=A0A540NNM6_MALBA|nr:hypothetical protein C1H46_001837 [Malus baccata]
MASRQSFPETCAQRMTACEVERRRARSSDGVRGGATACEVERRRARSTDGVRGRPTATWSDGDVERRRGRVTARG